MRSSEKKHWDRFWAASRNLDDVYGTDDRILGQLERYCRLRGLTVLEVGAGTGRDAADVAGRGASMVALDYSEESLSLISGAVEGRVAIVCGDALRMPFADGRFDVVYHQGLLEHFREPGLLLDENVRVLKPGGLLLVDVPQRYHYYTFLKHILIAVGKWFAGWETEFSVRQLRRLIEERDLQVLGIYGHNMSPSIWYRGLRKLFLRTGVRLPMYPRPPRLIAGSWQLLKSCVPAALVLNTSMVIGVIARKK